MQFKAIDGGGAEIVQDQQAGALIAECLAAFTGGCVDALYDLGVAFSTGSHGVACDMVEAHKWFNICLLYTSPSPRDATLSRMPSSA